MCVMSLFSTGEKEPSIFVHIYQTRAAAPHLSKSLFLFTFSLLLFEHSSVLPPAIRYARHLV